MPRSCIFRLREREKYASGGGLIKTQVLVRLRDHPKYSTIGYREKFVGRSVSAISESRVRASLSIFHRQP